MLYRTLLPLVLALGLSPAAAAQEWGLTLGRKTKHGHVSLTLGSAGAGISVAGGRHARPVYRPRPAAECRPGHYETVAERVWIPGRTEHVWVPARYEVWVDHCGNEHRRLIAEGHYRSVQHPGHYEQRTRRVWVPARYAPPRGFGRITYR